MSETRGFHIGRRARLGFLGVLAGASLVTAPAAGAAILHDQYNNFGADSGLASGDPPGTNNSQQAADDFNVPSGQTWSLESVDVRSQDGGALAANVFVYANAGSLPGGLLASRLNVTFNGALKDRSVPLTPAVTLQPGTYWIGVQGAGASWGWVERTVQTGLPAAWMTEQDGTPCENVFKAKGSCFPTDPDQVFRLNGTSQALPQQPSTTVKKKKCKKKGKKGAAAAKKKKCKKKKKKRKR
jgi:hypothetical protein